MGDWLVDQSGDASSSQARPPFFPAIYRAGKPYLIQMRAFRHRDFRLLWTGAFLSFIGSWVQIVAQGWHVYALTHDAALLGIVTFCGSAPVFIFGLFAGTLTDMYNKRGILIAAQTLFGLGALFLAVATHWGFIQYWHIVAVALLFGLVGCVETPTRQSLVSRVVPPEDLAQAIPLNAMTFNLARVIGPAIGAIILAGSGPMYCYLANSISYIALIYAVVLIKADTSATQTEPQPIKDLITEGMLYTLREARLKMLFLLEASTSAFGLFYLALMPAIVQEQLGLKGDAAKQGLGHAFTCIGIGAIAGLLLVLKFSDRPIKGTIIMTAMTVMGLTLLGIGFTSSPLVAYGLFGCMGLATVAQFNVTNTAFQMLSPDRLRGRVLSMHIWALSGLGPIGTLMAGYLARSAGIPATLRLGSACILAVAGMGWIFKRVLEGV